MSTSIQSLGGKARAANMTPEERTAAARHAATKGARKLGKEGRRLRALKGVATRKARAEAAQKWGSSPAVEAEIDATAKPGKLTCFCKGKLEPVDGFEVNHSPKSCGWIREGEPGTKAFFEAGRKAGHRLADNFVNASVGGMFSAGAHQARAWRGKPQMEALAEAVGLNGVSVKVEQAQKPKRPPPKPGTTSAKVLEVLGPGRPLESQQVAHELYYGAKLDVRNTTEAYALVKNALSSLRSAGHVVSEPKPGSRREKLWRLA